MSGRQRRARGAVTALVCAVVASGPQARALGDVPPVVILDSPGIGPFDEFVAVLRVQVRGSAGVRIGPPVVKGDLGERVGEAAAIMTRQRPLLVVWIEQAGESTYVVYAVGSKEDRALVEVVRVPATGSQDVARVMAIKVSNLVDIVLMRRAPESRDVAAAFAPPPPRAAEPTTRTGVSLEAGGVGALGAGDVSGQAGLGLGAAVEVHTRDWVLAGFAAARWLSTIEAEAEVGTMDIRELDGGLGVRAGRRIARAVVAGDLEVAARVLHAGATAADGREESATRAVPVTRAALAAEFALTERLGIRATAGIEVALLHQRFLLLDEPIANLGRSRLIAAISGVWHLR